MTSPKRRSLAAPWILLSLVSAALALVAPTEPAAAIGFDSLRAAHRLVDTRSGSVPAAGSTLRVPVAGVAGVPLAADSAVVNVTVDGATESGFVTVYPCDVDRPTASNLNFVAGRVAAVMVVTRLGDGAFCAYTSGATHLIVDVSGSFAPGEFVALPTPRRLLDTRPGMVTADARFVGDGIRAAGSTLHLPVGGRVGVRPSVATMVLTVTADPTEPGFVTVYPCDAPRPNASAVNYVAGEPVANTVISKLSADGEVCLFVWGATHLVVDIAGWLTGSTLTSLDAPARLLDTRPGFSTVDGRLAGKGQRPGQATLRVPVGGRAGIPGDASAVVLNVTAVSSAVGSGSGFMTVHPRGESRPVTSNLNFVRGQIVANAVIARLGAGGEICVFNSANTDVVIDVVGYLAGPAPVAGGDCPDQQLFPHWRMVALYGNDASRYLGVLGEQSPDEAAARLAEVASPWSAFGRPVLGAFEFIATVAQATGGADGLYRNQSSDEQVQRYLDAARRRGLQLIIDVQPGRSDFLTEVRRYEKFLREPDVGIAIDPEWHVSAYSVPGEVIGSVTAAEVNAVSEYVAQLVTDGDLPEKLFVVHQFQQRMIPDREAIVARSGLAITYHMDGFGTQAEKLATWSFVKTGLPFHNAFKLFYDEDIRMFSPSEVMSLDPQADLITYQ